MLINAAKYCNNWFLYHSFQEAGKDYFFTHFLIFKIAFIAFLMIKVFTVKVILKIGRGSQHGTVRVDLGLDCILFTRCVTLGKSFNFSESQFVGGGVLFLFENGG